MLLVQLIEPQPLYMDRSTDLLRQLFVCFLLLAWTD